jgi:hypothetical protein
MNGTGAGLNRQHGQHAHVGQFGAHRQSGQAAWAAGQSTGRPSTQALSLTSMYGSATTFVMGGSTSLGYLLVAHADF